MPQFNQALYKLYQQVVSASCIIKIIKILVNCNSLFLIPDRNTITVQSNFSLKVNSFHGNQKYIYFFWFAFSTKKFKDLVFTFRFLWLHSLYLLLPSLKLFLFLPTSSDGSCQLGLKGYIFFSRISSGK